MNILFCRSQSFSGLAIRTLTFSQWNHVAIEIDGVVYDTTGRYGVRAWTLSDFESHYNKIAIVKSNANKEKTKTFLERQLGKPYDFFALYAMPFRRNWQDEDKWFCSELVAAALDLKFVIHQSRVTPRDLWLILSLMEELYENK